jgi:hypothetical protein
MNRLMPPDAVDVERAGFDSLIRDRDALAERTRKIAQHGEELASFAALVAATPCPLHGPQALALMRKLRVEP